MKQKVVTNKIVELILQKLNSTLLEGDTQYEFYKLTPGFPDHCCTILEGYISRGDITFKFTYSRSGVVQFPVPELHYIPLSAPTLDDIHINTYYEIEQLCFSEWLHMVDPPTCAHTIVYAGDNGIFLSVNGSQKGKFLYWQDISEIKYMRFSETDYGFKINATYDVHLYKDILHSHPHDCSLAALRITHHLNDRLFEFRYGTDH